MSLTSLLEPNQAEALRRRYVEMVAANLTAQLKPIAERAVEAAVNAAMADLEAQLLASKHDFGTRLVIELSVNGVPQVKKD